MELANTNDELYSLILDIKPDIIVKGIDWQYKIVIGKNVAQVRFCPFYCDISTTKIVESVKRKI